jgi:toxin ParE1/3/4
MPKPLEWSERARRDLLSIAHFYTETVSPTIAHKALTAIDLAALRLCSLPADYRLGKDDTREYVMRRFPYTIIYRATAKQLRIVRVLHQARRYFNA